MALRSSEWRNLPMSLAELCIDTTLRCGQSFRWRKMSDVWHCTLAGRIISLKQDPEYIHYRVTWPKTPITPPSPPASALPSTAESTPEAPSPDDTELLLKNYFNLHHSLTSLYTHWSAVDPNFRARAPAFTGIRILNQPAWEALVAFICSSNNNITRISQMVANLCLHWGAFLGHSPDASRTPMHDFPTPAALAGPDVEARLRELGFGYRARYIAATARVVATERPAGWLLGLRNPASVAWGSGAGGAQDVGDEKPSYKRAHEQLLQLTGVGPKVADCVCLMGLGWLESVPVDTHVWQIAMRDYHFGGKSKNKTLTKAMYDAVGDHFRELWGEEAGWAHSVLFTADLKTFSDRRVKKEETVGTTTTIKAEQEDVTGLVTPVSTPVGTPAKGKRALVAEKVEDVKVKMEDLTGEMSAVRRTRKRRRVQV